MINLQKKIGIIILTFFLFISSYKALEINSQYAVLYNLNDKTILYEKNKDEVTSIASLTKIMTTIVAIEKIEDFNQKVTITPDMYAGLKEQGAACIGLKEGQVVTFNDLLYGVLLASGADAANALAVAISGNVEDFVELMNQKAQDLKLTQTHFTGTVGLDNPKHYSTVNEVAQMLMYALENPKFQEIFTTDSYLFSDKSFTVKSSMRATGNAYHLNTSNILGGKTGFTNQAGRALASIAYDQANDIKYLLVTTKAAEVPNHLTDAINIYDYYFQNYKYQDLIKKNEPILTLKTKYSKTKQVAFKAQENVQKYLINTYNQDDVKIKYNGLKIITPQTKEGKIGTVQVFYQNELIKELPIILNNKIKFSLLGFLIAYKYITIAISIILIVLIVLIYLKRKKK